MGVGEECTRGWVPKTVPKVRLVGREVSQQEAGEPVHTQAQLLPGPGIHVHPPGSAVLSHVQLFVTPKTVAHQAPLSMEFSR